MSNSIVFLLGAGASYPYGVPMMSGFYSEFRDHVRRRHPACFDMVLQFERSGLHSQPDLETLLSDVQRVAAVEEGLKLIGGNEGAVRQQVNTARELRGYLDAFVVDRCERFDRDRASKEMQGMLQLHSVGPLWVFTTNYDRIVELACDSLGITWSDGFEVNSPNAVANWQKQFDTPVRVVKLHGSVNWFEDDPAGVLHRLDRGYPLPAYDFRLMRGDQLLKPLMIIPTLEKQALSDPYIGLAMKFTDVLRETKLLIVVGNSLRDKHIKGYIRERLGELHILLISPNAAQNRGIFCDSGRTHALNTGCSEFLTFGGSRLLELAQALARPDLGSAVVHGFVERFVEEVSHLTEEDRSMQANPDLYRIWKQLNDDAIVTRIAAVKALANHHHPAVISRLSALLESDPNSAVRVAAIDSLAHASGAEAVQAAASALMRDASQDVQLEAALALISMARDGRVDSLLREALGRADLKPIVRRVIEEALSSGKG